MINQVLHASQSLSLNLKYAAMCGITGAVLADSGPPTPLKPTLPLANPCRDIESVIPYTKYMILRERSMLMDFALKEFKLRVKEGEVSPLFDALPLKKGVNAGVYALVKKPGRARYIPINNVMIFECLYRYSIKTNIYFLQIYPKFTGVADRGLSRAGVGADNQQWSS